MNCKMLLLLLLVAVTAAHDAKDFDDSVLYKIDFEVPNLLSDPVGENKVLLQ